MTILTGATKPLRSFGEFFTFAGQTLTFIPRRPVAWREFLV